MGVEGKEKGAEGRGRELSIIAKIFIAPLPSFSKAYDPICGRLLLLHRLLLTVLGSLQLAPSSPVFNTFTALTEV